MKCCYHSTYLKKSSTHLRAASWIPSFFPHSAISPTFVSSAFRNYWSPREDYILPFFLSSFFPWGFWERSIWRRPEDVLNCGLVVEFHPSESRVLRLRAMLHNHLGNVKHGTTNLPSLGNTLCRQFVRQTIIGLQSQQLNFVVQKFHSGDELFPIYFSLRSKIYGRCFRFEAPHSILTNVSTWENINMCWPFFI